MLFVSLWEIAYENRYVAHPWYLNTFVTIEKIEPRNYDWNSITTDFSKIFFQKNYLDLTVTKPKSNIRTLSKRLGKHVKQNYHAAFSQPLIEKSNSVSVKSFCF